MEHISLLPVEFKSKKKRNRKLGISTIAMGIVAGILIFALVILKILSVVPESELRALKLERKILQNEIDDLLLLKTLSEEVKQQKKLLDKAIGNQPDWFEIFAFVGAELPENVNITNILANYTENSAKLNIQGNAMGHDEVALWMKSLNNTGFFSDTGLNYSRMENSNAISFELDVTIIREEKFKLFDEVVEK